MTTNSTTGLALRVAIHAALLDLDRPATIEELHGILTDQGHRVGGRTVEDAIVRLSSDGEIHRITDDGRTVLASLTPIDAAATVRDQITEVATAAADQAIESLSVDESWSCRHRAALIEQVGDSVEAAVGDWVNRNTVMIAKLIADKYAEAVNG
ncbi:hypothetical protein [Rhodococcus sp. PD04]|uniref:hypothetical protein n=1 Tax=Rhodococcus sp. PD04 TaxID=3109594 RepID=UPI002DD91423|nr:hypothetical protein [Rhodococcus sp. PD04]WSE24382.1 hypothetical protein U9J23_08910 [Rhodococcus sp. PD04]